VQTFYIIFSLLSCCAAVFDFLFYRIPNIICILIALFFFAGSTLFYPLDYLMEALLFSAGTFGVCFLLYAVRVLGAGDAKFLAVAALWAGGVNFSLFILTISICGGLLGLFYLFASNEINKIRLKINIFLTKFLQDSILWTFYKRYKDLPFTSNRLEENKKVILPYGVAICGGCLAITYIKIWGS
jgi:prepilin peptidase CpaA